jgi:cyanate lyase
MFRSSAAEARARPLVHTRSPHEPIHEEFGDGIMSAIDFSMDITREPDPKGDRVNVVLSGKFLPYKTY